MSEEGDRAGLEPECESECWRRACRRARSGGWPCWCGEPSTSVWVESEGDEGPGLAMVGAEGRTGEEGVMLGGRHALPQPLRCKHAASVAGSEKSAVS